MDTTSKSPRKILLAGYVVGQLSLPCYAHKFSPKTYTQPQLFACLVLKEFLHRDYRGIAELLKDTPDLAAAIDLEKVPHFTSLQKAPKRLLRSDFANRLLDKTVRLGKFVGEMKSPLPRAAMEEAGITGIVAGLIEFAARKLVTTFKERVTILVTHPPEGPG